MRALARDASNDEVKKRLDQFVLPFAIRVDHRLVTLAVAAGKERTEVKAPAGTTGEWTHTVTYPVGSKVVVEARRPGYRTQSLTISADARKAGIALILKRGHAWHSELGAEIGAAPTVGSGQVVVATHKPSLEIIEVTSGTARAVAFANNLDRFAATPLVDGNRAYAVLDDRLVCVDIVSRLLQWQYPDPQDPALLDLNPASLFVQPNPLILGQTQIFAGSVRGKIYTLAWDGLTVVTGPVTELDSQITGAPLVDHHHGLSTLYMPTTNGLDARDPTEADAQTGLEQRWFFASGGELVGRPTRVEIKGKPAILICDATGMVLAIDADPRVAEADRKIAAWPIDGGISAGATVHAPSHTAYVASGGGHDGAVVALDLDNVGQQRWRFPAQGAIGAIAGSPAVGRRGIYVGDDQGHLYCLDRDTGVERWQVDLGAKIVGGILAHEGRIFVPAFGGSLSCFDEGED
ncbi:MAG: PQQ-binding-like beta-propeller repeat protein [Planctomycetes bacterium]|nr:PQQ-binding-like beta-propeller repeat protein [Planctomycetota bacterium]